MLSGWSRIKKFVSFRFNFKGNRIEKIPFNSIKFQIKYRDDPLIILGKLLRFKIPSIKSINEWVYLILTFDIPVDNTVLMQEIDGFCDLVGVHTYKRFWNV